MARAFDVIVIGAGAAGLYCAGLLGQRGRRVLVLDHARRIGEKIRISGGGRCNFTNLNGADHRRYLSGDPRFVRHALRAHPPAHFIAQVRAAGIRYHEKHLGQLFCDDSSQQIIRMLLAACQAGEVRICHPASVRQVDRRGPGFVLGVADAASGLAEYSAPRLVVATGGLSIPAIGASDYAWQLAGQWQMATVPHRPGLVPLVCTAAGWAPFRALSGVALPVSVSLPPATAGAAAGAAPAFAEDLLFTHRGLSGPAALQISSYWQPGQSLLIDVLPGLRAEPLLLALKAGDSAMALPADVQQRLGSQPHRQQLGSILAALMPARLGRIWLEAVTPMLPPGYAGLAGLDNGMRLAEVSDSRLRLLAKLLKAWPVLPAGTEGYRKAEVSVGGVATAELDPRTLQSHRVPGSYWIGEAVDVTGWLGGYNFQWAWSSAHAAAMAICSSNR